MLVKKYRWKVSNAMTEIYLVSTIYINITIIIIFKHFRMEIWTTIRCDKNQSSNRKSYGNHIFYHRKSDANMFGITKMFSEYYGFCDL